MSDVEEKAPFEDMAKFDKDDEKYNLYRGFELGNDDVMGFHVEHNEGRFLKRCAPSDFYLYYRDYRKLLQRYELLGNEQGVLSLSERHKNNLGIAYSKYTQPPYVHYYSAALLNLAYYYEKYDVEVDSIGLLKKSLAIREYFYKKDEDGYGVDYAKVMVNLASSYHKIGETDKSIEYCRKSLGILESSYEKDNEPKTLERYLKNIINLAFYISEKNGKKDSQILSLYEKALDLCEKNISEEDSQIEIEGIKVSCLGGNPFDKNRRNRELYNTIKELYGRTKGEKK